MKLSACTFLQSFQMFFNPYPEKLLDHVSKLYWEVYGLKSKRWGQWRHEYIVFVTCFHLQLWIKGKIGDCELMWVKKWRERGGKRNGVGTVHNESTFWGVSAINAQKVSGTSILFSSLGIQVILVTRASVLLIPTGNVHLLRVGIAEEGEIIQLYCFLGWFYEWSKEEWSSSRDLSNSSVWYWTLCL